MKSKTMKHLFCRSAWAACLMGAAMIWQSCEDELLTGQPSWLGESIYAELEKQGNYKTTLQLINDLGEKEVLSQTGSRTLFVADDDAYAKWFQENDWGVRSYDQLSVAQKKLLFYTSMINNAYLVELLSNVSANPPQAGLCMRRETMQSIYDSIYTMQPDEMPKTAVWDRHREKPEGIVLMKDETSAPMIHFLPAFMEYYKITDMDLQKISGDTLATVSDAWVNGKKIIERDITCKNGYIHKVDGVIEPTTNMAEIIRQNPVTSRWSNLLDRFSAPYYNDAVTKEYNRLFQTQDSVFELRYYSEVSDAAWNPNNTTPDGDVAPNLLPFDPGWNQFIFENTMNYDMHYDAGMMIVPTDEKLEEWFATGEGKVLKEQFGCWDSIPDQTLRELLAVNMVETLTDRVPSKFDNVLNDAQVKLGIQPRHIIGSEMGCNGVVFVVDTVFSPSAYSSVTFPALIREETLSVIYWAMNKLEFLPYLNSMESDYSLILPTNNALLTYVDPINYGEDKQTMIEFYYDELEQTVKGRSFFCTVENGVVTKGRLRKSSLPEDILKDRLEDLIDQMIIVGLVEEGGYEYYKTKGGSLLRVQNANDEKAITYQGGWQIEQGNTLHVQTRYPESNGVAYEVNDQMPLGATRSVYNVLSAKPEYEQFLGLLLAGEYPVTQSMLLSTMGTTEKYTCANSTANYNISLFDNYNYTVYVPSNEAILNLVETGILPTWADYDSWYAKMTSSSKGTQDSAKVACEFIESRINSFIRYHVQDNSIIMGGAPSLDVDGNELITNNYESMMINPENGRFYPIQATCTADQIELVDAAGKTVYVNPSSEFSNQICREYWFRGKDFDRQIYMESDAVVHLLNGALSYKADMQKWQDELNTLWSQMTNK